MMSWLSREAVQSGQSLPEWGLGFSLPLCKSASFTHLKPSPEQMRIFSPSNPASLDRCGGGLWTAKVTVTALNKNAAITNSEPRREKILRMEGDYKPNRRGRKAL